MRYTQKHPQHTYTKMVMLAG